MARVRGGRGGAEPSARGSTSRGGGGAGSTSGEDASSDSAAATAAAALPYNMANVLLARSDIDALLAAYAGAGVACRDPGLYLKALTHRSYCTRKNESFLSGNTLCPPGCVPLQRDSNERLEFLGDAVLYLVTSAYLLERYPGCDEGFLTRMRTKLVCGSMLAGLCRASGLHRFIIMSQQTEDAQGRGARAVLEDAYEAFLGALYLDAGYDAAHRWLVGFLEAHVDFAQLVNSQNNPKDVLNRYMQRNLGALPTFEEGEGAAVVVRHRGTVVASGAGPTRREAEDDAARKALAYFNVPGAY